MVIRGLKTISKKLELTDGSFTMEAAFVVSLILIILGGFLVFGFELHDEIVTQILIPSYLKQAIRIENEPIDAEGSLITQKVTEVELFSSDLEDNQLLDKLSEQFSIEYGRSIFTMSVSEVFISSGNNQIKLQFTSDRTNEATISYGLRPETFVRLYRGVVWRNDEDYLCQ